MNNIFSQNIIWSVGIIIILFGFIASHRLSGNRRKKERFTKVCDKFSYAFEEFRAMLETNFQYEIGAIKAPIPDHIAAAFEFRRHLGWFRRKGFDRKLAQYKLGAKEYQDIEKYVGLKNIPHETNRKLLKQIDSLLKYANYK